MLLLGPELHLAGLLAAHLVHLVDGVLLQVVVTLGVVGDGVELVVDAAQIRVAVVEAALEVRSS